MRTAKTQCREAYKISSPQKIKIRSIKNLQENGWDLNQNPSIE